jgi:hypothetical protein
MQSGAVGVGLALPGVPHGACGSRGRQAVPLHLAQLVRDVGAGLEPALKKGAHEGCPYASWFGGNALRGAASRSPTMTGSADDGVQSGSGWNSPSNSHPCRREPASEQVARTPPEARICSAVMLSNVRGFRVGYGNAGTPRISPGQVRGSGVKPGTKSRGHWKA